MPLRILVLHGPNLNLLGTREPAVYGTVTLGTIDRELVARATRQGVSLDIHQTNHEGVLVDLLHANRERARGVLINPGGLTHTSVVLRDAIASIGLPAVEVHLTHVDAREDFRRISLVAPACIGRVAGFGPWSYFAALDALVARIRGEAPA